MQKATALSLCLMLAFLHCLEVCAWRTILFFYLRTACFLGLGTLFSWFSFCALPACWDWAHCFLIFHFSHCPFTGTEHTIFSFFIFLTALYTIQSALFPCFDFFTLPRLAITLIQTTLHISNMVY